MRERRDYLFMQLLHTRSYDLQNRLYHGYIKQEGGNAAVVDTYSARPGHSEHQTGRAIDLCGSFGSLNDFIRTPESAWVSENCYQYGFYCALSAGHCAADPAISMSRGILPM